MPKTSLTLAMVVLALAPLASAPVLGQAPIVQAAPVLAADRPYSDLYDSMVSGFDMSRLADAGADAIFDGLVRNEPAFAELAGQQPDLKARFRDLSRPYLQLWMERGFRARRGAFVAKAKPIVTPGEAAEIAAFFVSPLGKKLMGSVASNLTLDDTMDKTMQSRDYKGVSSKDESRMVTGAVGDLNASMTAEEQDQALKLSSRPAFRKLPALTNALKSIPEPAFDDISTKEEREGFAREVQSFLKEARARN